MLLRPCPSSIITGILGDAVAPPRRTKEQECTKPMSRLVALDVDGTLMRSDNTLSPRNARAVTRAQQAGWRVVLATGKPPWALVALVKQLDLVGPHIVANGCAFWHRDGSVEVLARIPLPGVRTALGFASMLAIPRAVSGPRGVFTQADWGEPEVTAALREVGEEPPTMVDDALAADADPWKVILILRRGTPHPPAPIPMGGRWVRTHSNFFETVPGEASKGAALALLCNRVGIPQQQVVAMGDGENDLEMLRWAGVGIAMAQAPAEVQAAASSVTAGNDEDGVAQSLEALLGPPRTACP